MREAIDARLAGRLVMVGFGSIGQGALPLIRRHVALDPARITIFTAHDRGRQVAQMCGVTDFRVQPLARGNFRALLQPLLGPDDLLLNLSFDVSSVALIELCHETGTPYLDSCIEPWAGGYYDPAL